MGRLKTVASRLAPPPARLGFGQRDDQGHSATLEHWRGWYHLARWKRLRAEVLKRDLFTCQCGCGHIEHDTAQLVADHIKPHRGDPALFWDPLNVRTLRKSPCHDKIKQAEEHRDRFGLHR